MTTLSVARTIARSESEVEANNGKTELEIARILALGPDAAALVKGTGTPPATGNPSQPSAPALVIRAANDWTVTWAPPSPPGTQPVSSWRVQWTPQGGTLQTAEVALGTLTFTGTDILGPSGNTVNVFVRSVNSFGQSAGSSATAQIP